MSLLKPLRAKQTTISTGTGTLTLIAPSGDDRSFEDVYGAGPVVVPYVVVGDGTFEIATGTFTAPDSLARDGIVVSSSNSDSLVSFAAGTKEVFCWDVGGHAVVTITGTDDLEVGDWGNLLKFTHTAASTLNLPALADVPADYEVDLANDGTAVWTLDGASAEQVNGAATYDIDPGEAGRLNRDGSAWKFRYRLSTSSPGAVAPVVIGAKNVKMSATSAGATQTFTADEVVYKTALGGKGYKSSAYSKAVNLATTGAAGMDTGTAPVSGYVAVYAIIKKDGTTSILACAVATSSGEIYGGANMPAGYVASCLLGIWPTNGSSQFPVGYQLDRQVWKAEVSCNALSGGTGSFHSMSIATAVPPSAKTFGGYIHIRSTANGQATIQMAADSAGVIGKITAQTEAEISAATSKQAVMVPFSDVPIITAQTTYVNPTSDVDFSGSVYISSYTF